MTKAGIAKIKVIAVSYLNTVPFIYGMDYSAFSGLIDLRLANPSKCFHLLQKGDADIALVPVGSLPMIGKCNIITPHCIGANGNVGSVFLLSDSPIENIKTVYCDLHSMTSNKLAEILCRDYWKVNPVIRYPETYPPTIHGNDGIIAIGDKSFKMLKSYKYQYDLAQAWKEMTMLPFVFAVWVTKKNMPSELLNAFNEALNFGIQNIPDSIEYCQPGILPVDEILHYLKHNVIHIMNDSMREGLFQFLNLIYPDFQDEIKLI